MLKRREPPGPDGRGGFFIAPEWGNCWKILTDIRINGNIFHKKSETALIMEEKDEI